MKYNADRAKRDRILKLQFENITGKQYKPQTWKNIKSSIYKRLGINDIMHPEFRREIVFTAKVRRVKQQFAVNETSDVNCYRVATNLVNDCGECDRETFYNYLINALNLPTTRRFKYYLFRKVGWLGGVMNSEQQLTVAINACKWKVNKGEQLNVKDYSQQKQRIRSKQRSINQG